MLLSRAIRLHPYDVNLYIMSTTDKKEDKDAVDVFYKESKKLGIHAFGPLDDGRDFESAFADGGKRNICNCCIYIRNKKINHSSLDHELIHCFNFINQKFAVSTKSGEDEATAYFFEFLKRSVLQVLKEIDITVTEYQLDR